MVAKLDIEKLIAEVRLSLEGTAKNATHRLFGGDGPAWGTSFEDLEELAVQIGQVVAQQVLQQSLQAQAHTAVPAATQRCSCCGRDTTPHDPEPHVVQTRAGEVTWSEPTAT